jgi:hypothetical protein
MQRRRSKGVAMTSKIDLSTLERMSDLILEDLNTAIETEAMLDAGKLPPGARRSRDPEFSNAVSTVSYGCHS